MIPNFYLRKRELEGLRNFNKSITKNYFKMYFLFIAGIHADKSATVDLRYLIEREVIIWLKYVLKSDEALIIFDTFQLGDYTPNSELKSEFLRLHSLYKESPSSLNYRNLYMSFITSYIEDIENYIVKNLIKDNLGKINNPI